MASLVIDVTFLGLYNIPFSEDNIDDNDLEPITATTTASPDVPDDETNSTFPRAGFRVSHKKIPFWLRGRLDESRSEWETVAEADVERFLDCALSKPIEGTVY